MIDDCYWTCCCVYQLCLPMGVPVEVIVCSVVTPNHVFLQQPTHPTFPSLERQNYHMRMCYSVEDVPHLPRPINGKVSWVSELKFFFTAAEDNYYVHQRKEAVMFLCTPVRPTSSLAWVWHLAAVYMCGNICVHSNTETTGHQTWQMDSAWQVLVTYFIWGHKVKCQGRQEFALFVECQSSLFTFCLSVY